LEGGYGVARFVGKGVVVVRLRRVVGVFGLLACVVLIVGQVPFGVEVGAQDRGREIEESGGSGYRSAGVVPGLASEGFVDAVVLPELPEGAGEMPPVGVYDPDATVGREIVGERTEFSQSFERSDGMVEVRVSPDPVAFDAGGGALELIDTSVRVGRDGGLVVDRNSDRVYFGDSSEGVEIVLESGRSVTSRPAELDGVAPKAPVKPEVDVSDDSVVWYRQVWPGVDVRYSVRVGGLAEDVVFTEAPAGAGVVGFAVSGAEFDPVWVEPASGDDAAVDGSVVAPEPLVSPANSLVRPVEVRAVDDVEGRVGDARSVRVVADAEKPSELARSSVRARGELAEELTVGPLVAFSGVDEQPVFDPAAAPLMRSVVTAPGESLVEVSVSPVWIGSLEADAFPVVLDPDFLWGSNGWRGYYSHYGYECGSGTPYCLLQAGSPQNHFAGDWRTVFSMDLTSLATAYGLHGSGSWKVAAASMLFNREAGSTAGVNIRLWKDPTAWSYAGAIAGGQVGVDYDTSQWSMDSTAQIQSMMAASTDTELWGVSGDVGSYTLKEMGVGLALVINAAAPPAPTIAASAPDDGEQWFARSATSAPTLAVDPVTDSDIHPSQNGLVHYTIKLAEAPSALSSSSSAGALQLQGPGSASTMPLSAALLEDGHTYWWRAWSSDGWVSTPGPIYSFTYDRRLGTAGPSPMSDFGPVSVNAATGNLVFSWSSRQVATLGGGAGVSLSYNSLLTEAVAGIETTPGLPDGWQGSWGELPVTKLEVVAGGSAVLRLADGSREAYRWNTVGTWEPVEETVHSIFTTAGSGYQWQSPSGWTITFDSTGKITAASNVADDSEPTALTYHWDDASGPTRLRSVRDTPVENDGVQRRIGFLYGGDAGCPSTPPSGLIAAPEDVLCRVSHMDGSITALWYVSNNGTTQLARIVEDGNGSLSTGTDDQAVWDLGWNTNHQIASIRTPGTNRLIAAGEFLATDPGHTVDAVYDASMRVSSLTGAKPDATHARPKLDYSYPSETETKLTDANRSEPNGFTTRYTLDARGRATKVEDRMLRATHTRWEDPAIDRVTWTDTQSLNATGQSVFLRTGTVYDHRGRPIESWGPAERAEFGGATSETTGTATGGANTPVTTTTYDGGLSGFATQFWDNVDHAGQPAVHGHDSDGVIYATGAPAAGVPADDWSARATGSITFPAAGVWEIHIASYGPMRARIGGEFIDMSSYQDPGEIGGSYLWGVVTVTATAGETMDAVIDFADTAGAGGIYPYWRQGSTGGISLIPTTATSPEFGLVTATSSRVNASSTVSSSVSYDDPATSGVDESYLGVARVRVQDPGGANLVSTEVFEPVGSGYLRRVGRQLPSGAGSLVDYDYYAPSDGPISSVCGVGANTPQLGFVKQATQADPDGTGPESALVRQYVYDSAGRQVGYRASTAVASEPWTCTSFDDAGRVSQVSYPRWAGQPARTVATNYSVGGDPLVSALSDPAGSVATTVDWAGRVVSYEDVWNLSTATTYDDLGRVVSRSNAGGTLAYSYGNDDQVTQVAFNGQPVAVPTYDTLTRMNAVSYPAGAGNAGNGTAGVFGYDNKGLAASAGWLAAGGAPLSSDTVTERDLLNRVVNTSTDGYDVNGTTANYTYDGAGRLSSAVGFGATPAPGAPARSTSYGFASSGGCGAATTAGANGNRSAKTVGATAVNYCYDHADRLTATDDPAAGAVNVANGTLGYDAHGNTTRLGMEAHHYDIADRHMATSVATTSTVGTAALLMVGDPGVLTNRDNWMKTRLEGAGWSVSVADDDTITLAQADAADLVVVAESTQSAKSAVIKATTAGVVSTESWGWDDMGLATSVGADSGEDDITIVDSAHPLAGGNSNGLTVTSTQTLTHGWGQVGTEADVVATKTGDVTKASVFSYSQGDTLADSSTAQGRRVGWFFYGGNPTYLNTTANDLFDAAIGWAGTTEAPVSTSTVGTAALLMVGDPGVLTNRDNWMKTRLEGAGWSVSVADDDTITLAQADAADLVVVAESTQSAKSAAIKATTAGVVSTESWGWDDMGLATSVGADTGEDDITIVDSAHPLADGNSNGLTVTSTQTLTHGWGAVGAAADVVATKTGDASKASIFAYEEGDTLVDSSTAQGRRVGWFFYGGNPTYLNTTANDLFDAAIGWAGTIEAAAQIPTVVYDRDATDRIVARAATAESTVRYGHTGAGDAPQVVMNTSNQVITTTLALPGGAILHYQPNTPTASKWSYPNLQGSIIAQTDATGAKTGTTIVYDPDGIPVAGGLPDTRPGDMDDTWLGAHTRPLEHATGLQPVIEMGARQYHPILARFLEVDPIEAGTTNDYTYVTDPINGSDPSGESAVGACMTASAGMIVSVSGSLCFWMDHRGKSMYTWTAGGGIGYGLNAGIRMYASNVNGVDDLVGGSVCGTIGVGYLVGASVEGCYWERGRKANVIVSLGVDINANFMAPVSGSLEGVYTGELYSWVPILSFEKQLLRSRVIK
jgi:RHS repeat-associated protein